MNKIDVPQVKRPEEKKEVQLQEGVEAAKIASDNSEIYQLMESRDEQQMMQEIMGVYAKEYVYDIPFGGGSSTKCDTPGCFHATKGIKHTHVRGLSWSGIKEARRIFKGIDTSSLTKPTLVEEDGKKYYECGVTALDLRTGNSTKAFKRHPLLKKTRGGGYLEDPFSYEIVQSKAKRNAISELLPQPLIRAWIGDYLKGKQDFDPQRVVDIGRGDFRVSHKAIEEETTAEKPAIVKKAKEYRQSAKVQQSKDLSGPKIESLNPNVTKIIDALKKNDWDVDDPAQVTQCLQDFGITSRTALEKADEATLDKIIKEWHI